MPEPKRTPFTRTSTILKVLDASGGLERWQKRRLVEGLVSHDELLALGAAALMAGDDRKLDEAIDRAIEAARAKSKADLGTALHSFLEQSLRQGRDEVTIPQPWRASVEVVLDRLDSLGAKIVDVERIVFVPELNVVGTFDQLFDVDGRLIIGDLKTGNAAYLLKPKLSAQLAAYSHASRLFEGEPNFDGFGRYLLPDPSTRSWRDLEGVDREVGLVIHLDAETNVATHHYVDLVEGWRFARLARDLFDLQKSTIDRADAPPPVGMLAEPTSGRRRRTSSSRPAEAAVVESSGLSSDAHSATVATIETEEPSPASEDGSSVSSRRAALRAIVRKSLAHEGFEAALRLRWPTGVAVLSDDSHAFTAEELAAIEKAIYVAQADVEVPF